MATALIAVPRRGGALARLESCLNRLNRRLTPDNILARAPAVAYEHGAAAAARTSSMLKQDADSLAGPVARAVNP
jgi:hypothetical protein